MAFRRPSSQLAEQSHIPAGPQQAHGVVPHPAAYQHAPQASVAPPRASEDATSIDEVLRGHMLPDALIERLAGLGAAPPHASRLVDRLAVALASHFHFLPLDAAFQTPILLYGMQGAGASTLVAKLAARFDEHEVLVIDTTARIGAEPTQLEEHLEVLGLPLVHVSDAATLSKTVAAANGRKVIIDASCGSPTDPACAKRIHEFAEAAGAQGMLVMSAETDSTQASHLAGAAERLGTRRMIATGFDTVRHIGSVLIAADTGKLALVAASITPQFAFGLRALTPENLARRLLAAMPRAERWRVAPL